MGLTLARVLGLKPILCPNTPFVLAVEPPPQGPKAGIAQSVGPAPQAKENQHPNRLLSRPPTKMHHTEKMSPSAVGHRDAVFVLGKHMSSQAFSAFSLGLSHKVIVVIQQG